QVGCYSAQALLIAADGGNLRDHRPQSSVGGAEHDRVAPRIAGAPQTDSVLVDHRLALQEGDGPAPVGDLHPGVDVVARGAGAGAETAVIVHQYDESGLGERGREAIQPML